MLKIFPDGESLNVYAAEKIVETAKQSIEKRGQFTIALAGGSTPKSLYQLLSSDDFKKRIDWSKTFFFFGDERDVLPDNAESNFRMADENLFALLNIAEANVFRWQTELSDAEEIAEKYAGAVKNFFVLAGNKLPRFDLILLGMGNDGHTASLFPNTEALNEREKIAVANLVEKLNTTRLTFTFPAINNARNIFFLVKGADKGEALKTVLEGKFQPGKFPAQAVKPTNGELFWLVDGEAAALLDR